MAISHEIKSQLAKLLATEDLIVEHKNVETACFNVHTRVLTLPMWEKASNVVYDLLVGHEVGHALFTPDEDWSKNYKIPPQFVNVVEDARIEKLMKRKYPGLSKTFFRGYGELSDNDFFSLEDEDISKFNLADRLNLQFKIGNYVDIPIEDGEERDIVNMVADSETFADALLAAEVLYKYCKDQQDGQKKVDDLNNTDGQSGSGSEPQDFVESDSEDGEKSDDNGESKEKVNDDADLDTPSYEGQQPESEEPKVHTESSLEENLKDLINMNSFENVYVELPKVNLETAVVDYTEIHEYVNKSYAEQQSHYDDACDKYSRPHTDIFGFADKSYMDFKKSAQKEVNYLVKEFECKKSADSYSRATVSKTGVLDCTKLHTYKYNEDLFKKVTTLADGKNHGLIFILDWSGSMADIMLDTVKQLFNLIWFCKKTNIPFEVYAFTNNWKRVTYDENNNAIYPEKHYEYKNGLIQVSPDFCLLNFISNRTKISEFEKCMRNIWRMAYSYRNHVWYSSPGQVELSGTPLNEALISLQQVLPKFQKDNKLQKVQCVVLTDGEAHPLNRHYELMRKWDTEPYMGTRSIDPSVTFLRDRKLGKTYKFGFNYHHFTETILNNLQDRFPYVNFIGIRVLPPREASRFMRLYTNYDHEKVSQLENNWKKNRSFVMKNVGYHAYFGLSSNALSQETEFDVKEDATKAQIRSAFKKSLSSKKMNKKILSEFISLVV